MINALLEIGCEELPVSYIEPALVQIKTLAEQYCAESMLTFTGPLEVAATPRRLILYLPGMNDKADKKIHRIMGPPERMYKDDNGEYTMAAIGFSKKAGVFVQDLKIIEGKICAEVQVGGEKTKKILARLFPKIIENIRFPKTMIWEETGFRFARPIRNICALGGGDVIRFTVAGVKSGKTTFGMFTQSRKKLEIPSAEKYFEKLGSHCIRVRPDDRKKYIASLIKDALASSKRTLLPDDALLHENAYLVEIPSVIIGEFGRKYLELPAEVLVTCMRVKQKFFTVLDSKGSIAPYFIGIRNGSSESQHIVREGYVRVLTARLEDAAFFYELDKRVSFETWLDKIKGVIFHEKLGSLHEKTERIKKITREIARAFGVDDSGLRSAVRAAHLCKADLVSALVFEYPELQGIAGKFYARHAGEPEDVCCAIEDHYRPTGQEDELPRTEAGRIVALADRIDSLAGYFCAGITPSGNKDPFGLRRLSLGVIRILLHNNINLDLEKIVTYAIGLYPEKVAENKDNVSAAIMEFFRQRLSVFFQMSGFAHDEINAILSAVWNHEHNTKDMTDAFIRLRAMRRIRLEPDFEALSAGYKRADNIRRQALEKNIIIAPEIDPGGLNEKAELDLYHSFTKIKNICEPKTADGARPSTQAEYELILSKMISLRQPLDTFFDAVMVMVADETIRANRLSLLNAIVCLYRRIADFSQIVVKPRNL